MALLLLGGCASREHIRPDHGEKTRAFLAKQRVHPEAAREHPRGLDSEESAIIHATYRKNLGGTSKTDKKSPSRVLIVEDDKRNAND
jgi:hypothetical protein